MKKNWQLAPVVSRTDFSQKYSDILGNLLMARGLANQETIEKFLQPDYQRDLFDPYLMADMDLAVCRLLKAIKENEAIVVYGDYDADGVSGCAILASFFQKINFTNFSVLIPDRQQEAYGLNSERIRQLAKDKAKLIITVDCGISNIAEAQLAKELGLDLIITDHHNVVNGLPEAVAVLDNKRPDDTYPFKDLSGAAMAFKLLSALLSRDRFGLMLGWEKWLLDLVAISSISDMVPLVGENRTLVYFGLKVLRQSRRPGLRQLMLSNKIKPAQINEQDVAFVIAPRLNSASRMAHGSEAYDLLMTTDESVANTLTLKLEQNNLERKQLVGLIVEQAIKQFTDETAPIVVVGDHSWPLGVLGLAASKLVEKWRRPVFVWGASGGEIKGSARSDGTVNLVDIFRSADGLENFFIQYGGHPMAGGFSLSADRLLDLTNQLNLAYQSVEKLPAGPPVLIDSELSLGQVNLSVWREVELLAPFGVANPNPVFLFRRVRLVKVKTFGNGGLHLELQLSDSADQHQVQAIGFFACPPRALGEEFDAGTSHNFLGVDLTPGNYLDLLATMEKSFWASRTEVRLRIVDLASVE